MESGLDLETGIDDFVGLQGGDEHVEDPEANEDGRSDGLDGFGAAQLASDSRVTTEHQDNDSEQSLNTEYRDGEAQAENK